MAGTNILVTVNQKFVHDSHDPLMICVYDRGIDIAHEGPLFRLFYHYKNAKIVPLSYSLFSQTNQCINYILGSPIDHHDEHKRAS
jgi:hypothetical protein